MGNIESSKEIYLEYDVQIVKLIKDKKQRKVLCIDNCHIDRVHTYNNYLMRVIAKNGYIYEDISIIIPSQKIKDHSAEKESAVCIMCLDHAIKTAMIDCGHACLCITCLRTIVLIGNGMCPKCRCPITRAMNIYLN